jgi:predicted phage-related endonuclease
MAVTGCKKWYLAVLVLGEGFHYFEIERDEDEINTLMDAEEAFWEFVEKGTPPPADGQKATTEAITAIYPTDNGESVSLMAYEHDLRQYMTYTESIKHLEKCRDECANKVKAFLGEAARGECDRYRVTWTSAQRQTFDAKRFAAEHPELDLSGYYKTSAYRTFKITENSK